MPIVGLSLSVQCAYIFWTPATSLFEYQCAFCLKLFIKHMDCLSHVTDCQHACDHKVDENINLLENPILTDEFTEANMPGVDCIQHKFEFETVFPEIDRNQDIKVKTEPELYAEYLDETEQFSGSERRISSDEIDNYSTSAKGTSSHKKSVPSAPNKQEKKTKPKNLLVPESPTCDKANEFSKLLLIHLGRKLKCEMCGIVRATRKGILEHMNKEHQRNTSALQCSSCPKVFEYACKLKQHQSRHEPRYSCEYCGNFFSHRGNLKTHMRIHTKERPYTCTICDISFTVSNTLTRHMRVHRGERPFPCPDCPKTFVLKNDLKRHSNVHTKAIKKICADCGKAFTCTRNLKRHEMTHSGERPHECEMCGKKFTQRNALKMHINTHTGNSPYSCKYCDRCFHSNAARKSHEKNVHKIP